MLNKLFVDGYTIKKNPSDIGGGFVVTNEDKSIIEHQKIIKQKYTNNEAEVSGLVRALELVNERGRIYTDSFVALSWIKRGNAKARPDLDELITKGKRTLLIKGVQIILVPREENLAGIYIENEQLESYEKQQHLLLGKEAEKI